MCCNNFYCYSKTITVTDFCVLFDPFSFCTLLTTDYTNDYAAVDFTHTVPPMHSCRGSGAVTVSKDGSISADSRKHKFCGCSCVDVDCSGSASNAAAAHNKINER